MTQKQLNDAQLEIAQGIDLFMIKHGIESDYQLAQNTGLNSNTARAIRKSGSLTTNTLLKLGVLAGYDKKAKNNLAIINRVLKDFIK